MSLLTRARLQVGWSKAELARRAQMEPSKLSKLERGVLQLKVDDLVQLAHALGCPPSVLLPAFSEEPALEAPGRP